MCTVVIRVPEDPTDPIRILAVRDEDPGRPWNPLGTWWPESPEVVGVQDRLAGGAWLAVSAPATRLSVLLNRAGAPDLPAEEITSRGGIVLDSVRGIPVDADPRTMGFNLVQVADGAAELVSWDGHELRHVPMPAGTHMIAHEDLDDAMTPRIVSWREEFALASTDGDAADWWRPWLGVLEESARLAPDDDRAIIRDNRTHGYQTLSLLACVATIAPGEVDVRDATLAEPGVWSPLEFG